MENRSAWVTLVTKPDFLAGALVLDKTLRMVKSRYPLVVMVTDQVPPEALAVLSHQRIKTISIDKLVPPALAMASANQDQKRFEDTWTKLRAFDLVQYERIVLLDSDMIVMRNMDELMTIEVPENWVAAAHACACNPRKIPDYPADWIPANCAHSSVKVFSDVPVILPDSPRAYSLLNSGLVVLKPSVKAGHEILDFLDQSTLSADFRFADQDVLSQVYEGRWKVLPWYYNALKTLRLIDGHRDFWRDEEIRCLHYILADKPWVDREGGGDFREMHEWWWDRLQTLQEEISSGKYPDDWNYVASAIEQTQAAWKKSIAAKQ